MFSREGESQADIGLGIRPFHAGHVQIVCVRGRRTIKCVCNREIPAAGGFFILRSIFAVDRADVGRSIRCSLSQVDGVCAL